MPSKVERRHNLLTAKKALKSAGLTNYTTKNDGYVLLFREEGRPAVDYYPSTLKWRYNDQTIEGSNTDFISWYKSVSFQKGSESVKGLEDALKNVYAAVGKTMDAVEILSQIIIDMDIKDSK